MNKINEEFIQIAKKHWGGHYAIFAFSTNYAVCFGTPTDEYYGFNGIIQPLKYDSLYFFKGSTLEDACQKAVDRFNAYGENFCTP